MYLMCVGIINNINLSEIMWKGSDVDHSTVGRSRSAKQGVVSAD
jgi:hypothetical protein